MAARFFSHAGGAVVFHLQAAAAALLPSGVLRLWDAGVYRNGGVPAGPVGRSAGIGEMLLATRGQTAGAGGRPWTHAVVA